MKPRHGAFFHRRCLDKHGAKAESRVNVAYSFKKRRQASDRDLPTVKLYREQLPPTLGRWRPIVAFAARHSLHDVESNREPIVSACSGALMSIASGLAGTFFGEGVGHIDCTALIAMDSPVQRHLRHRTLP
ncbi:hypothetical protein CBOM_07838 [Ceraceosorus bombacis]|uniref:Uncharacterized protein n=1 Tax=Ceraceosorus bombacis TaxID=401625 RepID=A0A0P1BPD7_9BASI|nr:hypothetical protein CBOM_07838 [Ceraceosorus bombacis]